MGEGEGLVCSSLGGVNKVQRVFPLVGKSTCWYMLMTVAIETDNCQSVERHVLSSYNGN